MDEPPSTEFETAAGATPETQITESSDGLPRANLQMVVLTVLAHPEASRIGEKAALPELGSGGSVKLGRGTPRFVSKGSRRARPLDDPYLSRKPIQLQSMGGGGARFVRGDSSTPVKVDGARLTESLEIPRQALEKGVGLTLGRRVALLLHLDSPGFEQGEDFGMVGESMEARRLRDEIRIAARLDVPVLIRGESGTGKELVARAIHDAGARSPQPYLAVNMAAVPDSLAAAEFFGAAKGAYTGAESRKPGFFDRAAGGTLFLDEIGETPDPVQPLLLRALESGEVQSVGGSSPRRVDIRLIAATDADLESKVAGGQFRMPLLHRLAGFEINVPPLRARRGDFGRLLRHFLRLELERLETPWPEGEDRRPWPRAGLVARLAVLDWRGNIRQLRNVARRMAIAYATGTEPQLDNLLSEAPQAAVAAEPEPKTSPDPEPRHGWRPAYRKPADVTPGELLTALREHDFQLKASAEALGISRASLYLLVEATPQVRKASELGADEVLEAAAATGADWVQMARALEVSVYALKRQVRALGLDLGL